MINPLKPTDHVPGSPGKVQVLIARYEAGVPMWLPGDRLRECERREQDESRRRERYEAAAGGGEF